MSAMPSHSLAFIITIHPAAWSNAVPVAKNSVPDGDMLNMREPFFNGGNGGFEPTRELNWVSFKFVPFSGDLKMNSVASCTD